MGCIYTSCVGLSIENEVSRLNKEGYTVIESKLTSYGELVLISQKIKVMNMPELIKPKMNRTNSVFKMTKIHS